MQLGGERQLSDVGGLIFWKYLQVVTITVAFVAGSWAYSLWMNYAGTRPKTLDVTVGRTIPLNTHGTVVFLTIEEMHKLHSLEYTTGLSLFSSVLIYVFRKPFGK